MTVTAEVTAEVTEDVATADVPMIKCNVAGCEAGIMPVSEWPKHEHA